MYAKTLRGWKASVLFTPVLRPVSSVTYRCSEELLLAHDNQSLKIAICHAQERDVRRVIKQCMNVMFSSAHI